MVMIAQSTSYRIPDPVPRREGPQVAPDRAGELLFSRGDHAQLSPAAWTDPQRNAGGFQHLLHDTGQVSTGSASRGKIMEDLRSAESFGCQGP